MPQVLGKQPKTSHGGKPCTEANLTSVCSTVCLNVPCRLGRTENTQAALLAVQSGGPQGKGGPATGGGPSALSPGRPASVPASVSRGKIPQVLGNKPKTSHGRELPTERTSSPHIVPQVRDASSNWGKGWWCRQYLMVRPSQQGGPATRGGLPGWLGPPCPSACKCFGTVLAVVLCKRALRQGGL